ncbi:hypothetical protein KQI36_15510 [Clostridium senegalense]|uniref:lysine 5,6-aminomutase reactivase subunit KamB n=1 Tax=Clostridium senegalense TaxID=1465809 RepID=UPI001C10C502|nr:hypothetical protein [Clostridium senegalense]
MNILDLIKDYESLSIIGMNKNVGKTTTLNKILEDTRGKYTLGLTSIGRDGEELDRVTATEKPRIYVEKDTIIATAKECLFNSDITREILKTTNIHTPMGEIVICRALSDGYVDLGGPSVNSYMADIKNELLNFGCDLVIVDGALSRKTFASPTITKATILSTGAALSRSMRKVVEETSHTVNLLSLPHETNEDILKICNEEFEDKRVGIIFKDLTFKSLNIKTSLEAAKEVSSLLDENVAYVLIRGVLTDSVIEGIMKSTNFYKNITFLCEDGTKLFLSKDNLYKFTKQGGVIKVLSPIKVLCVTTNPKSPYGYEFDKQKFVDALKEELDIPVFDVIGGV